MLRLGDQLLLEGLALLLEPVFEAQRRPFLADGLLPRQGQRSLATQARDPLPL